MKFCIHVPMFDSANPMKMIRNPRYENAARAVPGSVPVVGWGFGVGGGGHRGGGRLDPRVKLPDSPDGQRNWRKQLRRSSTNNSGTSKALKCRPRGCSFQ